MTATTEAMGLDRVWERISGDRELANSIQSIRAKQHPVYGYRLIVQSRPGSASQVNERLLWVIRVASSVIPLSEVEVDGDCISIEALQRVAISLGIPSDGIKDRQLKMQQVHQRASLFDSAIEVLSESYTVFTLTSDGKYEDVVLHKGTQSLISPDTMIGRYMAEVIGEHSTKTVLYCLKAARQTGEPQECFYDVRFNSGEQRWYQGRACPPKDEQPLQLFLVKRVR